MRKRWEVGFDRVKFCDGGACGFYLLGSAKGNEGQLQLVFGHPRVEDRGTGYFLLHALPRYLICGTSSSPCIGDADTNIESTPRFTAPILIAVNGRVRSGANMQGLENSSPDWTRARVLQG